MLTPGKTYDAVYRQFKWQIPDDYNIGVDVCDKWAEDDSRNALYYEKDDGSVETFTF